MESVALVVDDDPSILNVAERMLSALGWGALKANNPHVALELAKAHCGKIRLLITDVMMPDMDGIALAQAFAAENPSAAIVFMSGVRNPLLDKKQNASQRTLFLPKPFSYVEFEDVLRKLFAE